MSEETMKLLGSSKKDIDQDKDGEDAPNYYRDELNSGLGGVDNNVNYSIKDSKSFDNKTSITGKVETNDTTKDVEIVVPLDMPLDMPLISSEVSLILTWFENCVLTSKAYRGSNIETGVVRINNPTGATVKLKDTKLYIPAVTLSTEIDNKLLEQLKNRV